MTTFRKRPGRTTTGTMNNKLFKTAKAARRLMKPYGGSLEYDENGVPIPPVNKTGLTSALPKANYATTRSVSELTDDPFTKVMIDLVTARKKLANKADEVKDVGKLSSLLKYYDGRIKSIEDLNDRTNEVLSKPNNGKYPDGGLLEDDIKNLVFRIKKGNQFKGMDDVQTQYDEWLKTKKESRNPADKAYSYSNFLQKAKVRRNPITQGAFINEVGTSDEMSYPAFIKRGIDATEKEETLDETLNIAKDKFLYKWYNYQKTNPNSLIGKAYGGKLKKKSKVMPDGGSLSKMTVQDFAKIPSQYILNKDQASKYMQPNLVASEGYNPASLNTIPIMGQDYYMFSPDLISNLAFNENDTDEFINKVRGIKTIDEWNAFAEPYRQEEALKKGIYMPQKDLNLNEVTPMDTNYLKSRSINKTNPLRRGNLYNKCGGKLKKK